MGRRPFPRHEESGLVDLSCYLPYLPDPPDKVPIYVVPSPDSPFVHQHVYFKWQGYKLKGLSPVEGSHSPLAKFRNFSYNQVLMRRKKENKLHVDFETHVSPPPDKTIENVLNEYEHLDRIGAATVGLELLEDPESRKRFTDHEVGLPRATVSGLSRYDAADFLELEREKSLTILREETVSPQVIITSAIQRLASYLDSQRLRSEADERLGNDSRFYPLRMRHTEHLLSLSNRMLKEVCEVLGIEVLSADKSREADSVAV